MTSTEVKSLTDDAYLKIDAKIAREIEKGYRRAERTPEADLPEDWEDRITDDALMTVLGSQEAIDAWQWM